MPHSYNGYYICLPCRRCRFDSGMWLHLIVHEPKGSFFCLIISLSNPKGVGSLFLRLLIHQPVNKHFPSDDLPAVGIAHGMCIHQNDSQSFKKQAGQEPYKPLCLRPSIKSSDVLTYKQAP